MPGHDGQGRGAAPTVSFEGGRPKAGTELTNNRVTDRLAIDAHAVFRLGSACLGHPGDSARGVLGAVRPSAIECEPNLWLDHVAGTSPAMTVRALKLTSSVSSIRGRWELAMTESAGSDHNGGARSPVAPARRRVRVAKREARSRLTPAAPQGLMSPRIGATVPARSVGGLDA